MRVGWLRRGGGWRSAVDDLGREYYWDPVSEATSWERPNAIPAPPLGVRRHEVVAALETSRGRMVTAAEAFHQSHQLVESCVDLSDCVLKQVASQCPVNG